MTCWMTLVVTSHLDLAADPHTSPHITVAAVVASALPFGVVKASWRITLPHNAL